MPGGSRDGVGCCRDLVPRGVREAAPQQRFDFVAIDHVDPPPCSSSCSSPMVAGQAPRDQPPSQPPHWTFTVTAFGLVTGDFGRVDIEHPVLELHLHIFFLHRRQIGLDDVLVVGFLDVDRRRPFSEWERVRVELSQGTLAEHAAQSGVDAVKLPKGIPSQHVHMSLLYRHVEQLAFVLGSYVFAIFAMLLSGLSARTLIYPVGHFDASACTPVPSG